MPRYYNNRSYRPYKKAKRPTERIIRAAQTTVASQTTTTGYVWTCDTPSTVCQIKLDAGMDRDPCSALQNTIAYALVYVPEGYNANTLNFPALANDLYNPTKYVFISGVLNSINNEDHKYTRYGRKCSPGDRIALLFYNSDAAAQTAAFESSFTVVA